MKDYSQIVTKVTSTPWMITPEALRMMLEILDARMSGQVVDFDAPEKVSMAYRVGSVGVLNLDGPIFPKANLMTEMSGATSLEQFRSEFGGLLNDSQVQSILLNVDSPGGLSDMVDEMATEIHAASESKAYYLSCEYCC